MVSNDWNMIAVIIISLTMIILFVVGILGFRMVDGLYKFTPCVEHNVDSCIDCLRVYSFSLDDFVIEACEDHELVPTYQYKTDLSNCKKCSTISTRYGLQ